jgi:phospholipid/cholesterol/gamma-HCH transport system substrate-binding protein
MSRSRYATAIKFSVFAVVMVVLTSFLFITFAQYRSGSTKSYSAVFSDVSSLKSGETVRVAGARVGVVHSVTLRPDKSVLVDFDADQRIVLTTGTRATVRYLNLIGDRYLELTDGPGSTKILPLGSQIPADRTSPALDLDLLLGGLKPVIHGLSPKDVNALSAALLQAFQGQGDTVRSMLSETSSLSNTLADNDKTVQMMIDNLRTLLVALAKDGDKFSGAVDRLERLVTALAADRDPVGEAIDALDKGTASIADLLTAVRPPLAGTIDQLSRLAPLLDDHKDVLDAALRKAPENYRKLVRIGSYGNFANFYLCGLSGRVTDLQGRTSEFQVFKQEGGRCAEPK